jgi:hypothetical protein
VNLHSSRYRLFTSVRFRIGDPVFDLDADLDMNFHFDADPDQLHVLENVPIRFGGQNSSDLLFVYSSEQSRRSYDFFGTKLVSEKRVKTSFF